jgi:hypothetical protein
MKLPRLSALVLLSLVGLGSCSSPEPPPAPTVQEAAPPALDSALFERIAIIGASSSAGFNLQLETGIPTRLADFLDQALLVPHEVVYDGATELLFLAPEKMGGKMVEDALGANPTLLVAPDFLFWFFYGSGSNTEARRARLEGGLALLESFDCPVVIGDLPYMKEAAGGMIPYASMPAGDSFAGANERIRAWAAEHDNVAITPFVELNQRLKSGEPYTIGAFTWDPAELGSLLQDDHLHPNMAGTAMLTLEVLGSLATLEGATLDGVAERDPEELTDRVDDLISSRE